jgi:hypothetical protein
VATNYPGAIDNYTNPSSLEPMNAPSHAGQHANANDAIEAVETELGTNPKGSAATVKARLDGIEDGTRLASNSITATQIAANAVGSSELADNAVDTAAIQDSAVTSAKIADGTITAADVAADTFAAFGTVGNLLTANQASIETSTPSFGTNRASIAKSSDYALHGTSSLKVTCTSSGTSSVRIPQTGTNATPVVAGATYTGSFWVYSAADTANVYASLQWWDAAGSALTGVSGSTVALSAAWVGRRVTATAPANAAYVTLYVQIASVSGAEVAYVDQIGIWRGAGGTFSMPGVPVVGGSHIATNGAYVSSGTVAPEGVITAPPLSRYQQTSGATTATGAMEWVKATGTGSTGWVAGAEADTGWRNVSASLLNSRTGTLYIRRIGAVVAIKGGATGSDQNDFYTLPTGFRTGDNNFRTFVQRTSASKQYAGRLYTADASGANVAVAAVEGTPTLASGDTWNPSIQWTTTDAWPSSLPGT